MIDEVTFYKSYSIKIANDYGWKQTYFKDDKKLIGFRNPGSRCHLEVYLRSKRVITCLEHPKQGTSILERNGIGITEMRQIFEDPRIHTRKGKKL